MSLTGPSRTIVVEPLRIAQPAPVEPARAPAPPPRPAPEREPARSA